MSLMTRISENLSEARQFGPGVIMRHIAKARGAKEVAVTLRGVGRVHLRPGESDISTLRQVFCNGDYDIGSDSPASRRLKRRYDEILAAGETPVIIDAGANIGAASLWFGALWPKAVVVAIEPEQGNAAILHNNLDPRPGFIVLDAAIGATPGAVEIVHDATGWGSRTARSETGIPVVTVADAVSRVPNGRLFIAKIDIEGFEDELFAENLDWLDEPAMVLIEPHDWLMPGRHTSRSFQRAMAAREFQLFISHENLIYIRVDPNGDQ